MGISTATKGEKGLSMFFPNLTVFEEGAYRLFFLIFLHLRQEANGEGGEVVLM